MVWGWRIPFLMSIAMVLIGLYVRIKLHETPVFARAVERGEKLKSPSAQVLRNNFSELVRGTFTMVATYGLFYLMTTCICLMPSVRSSWVCLASITGNFLFCN